MQAIHPLFKGVLQDIRAEDEAQTRDPQLGRLMLYQLSYFRKNLCYWFCSASGKRWIRTTEGKNQQIYSLPHLATLVSSRLDWYKNLEPSVGFEPTTLRLQITCSTS